MTAVVRTRLGRHLASATFGRATPPPHRWALGCMRVPRTALSRVTLIMSAAASTKRRHLDRGHRRSRPNSSRRPAFVSTLSRTVGTAALARGPAAEGGRQAVVKYSPGSDGASERGGLT